MINLIRNELTKISKKKSIYITLLVTLAFVIFANVIYQIESDNYQYDLDAEIQFYEEELKNLNLSNTEDVQIYVSYQKELQIDKLIQKYGGFEAWQSQIINEQGYELIDNVLYYQYIEPNESQYIQAKNAYDNFVAKLDANDWQYFAKEDLKGVENNLQVQNNLKKQTSNKQKIAEIDARIQQLEVEKQILNWRLEKNICYGYDYYNQCLSNYRSNKNIIQSYENSDQSDLSDKEKYENKQSYYSALESAAIAQYDIEHETHTGDTTTAKGILLNIFTEFEIFIIIMAVMIAGTTVSEEFNKGTIKLLLIKPYTRVKILTAKFITSLIMLLIIIILVMFMQFVVGGIAQGFDSFGEHTVIYNHITNQLEEINTIKYLAIQTLGKLPIYVLLLTLAFAFSTIFTNSALAIAITLLGYMGSSTINLLTYEFNLNWIKFFVTPNWDLTQYFFGRLPMFEGLTMAFSIAIIVAYMIIMLVPTYIVFKKKNIKNI